MRESESGFSPEKKEQTSAGPGKATQYVKPSFLYIQEEGEDVAELYYSEDRERVLISSAREFQESDYVGQEETNAFPHRRVCKAKDGIESLQRLCK